METFLFTLFGSVIAFYATLILLIIVLITADLAKDGVRATIAFLIFLSLNYFWGTAPILELFTFANLAIYLVAGFLFSLTRTYFKGKELSDEQKKYYNLRSAVFRWWFLWPISAINWLFGQLLKDLYNWVYSKLAKIFEFLFKMPEEIK